VERKRAFRWRRFPGLLSGRTLEALSVETWTTENQKFEQETIPGEMQGNDSKATKP
jgi:hypothetical protein